MARPKKGEELGASAIIGVRVSDELRAAIEREAKRADVTLTDMVRTLIGEALATRAKRLKRVTGA